jgi:hypothetical protein
MPAFKGTNVVYEFDTTVYPELEESKAELWAWLKDAPFNIETKYNYLGEPVPDDMPEEIRKMIVIPTGYANINDLLVPAGTTSDPSTPVQDSVPASDNPYADPNQDPNIDPAMA